MPTITSAPSLQTVAQPPRPEAARQAAPAPQQPAAAQENLTISEAASKGQPLPEISFGDRLGTASKFGLAGLAGGVVIGALHGAKTYGSGGGYGAAAGAVLGGMFGALKGGAIGLAAGGASGLIYSYASEKSGSTPASATPAPAGAQTPVTEAKGIDAAQPIKKDDFWGDVSKGSVAGVLTGTVAGAVVGGAKGAKGGGHFTTLGIFVGGLVGALSGAGIGLVGGGVAGAIYNKAKN